MFKYALVLAGLAQIAIALTSLAIPRVLGWREETRAWRPLTRQVFWTYSSYILTTNLAFGILTVAAPAALLDGSTLAAAVTGFIAVYWAARVILQFALYDRSVAAGSPALKAAEALYVAGFTYVALTNAAAALHNAGVVWMP